MCLSNIFSGEKLNVWIFVKNWDLNVWIFEKIAVQGIVEDKNAEFNICRYLERKIRDDNMEKCLHSNRNCE